VENVGDSDQNFITSKVPIGIVDVSKQIKIVKTLFTKQTQPYTTPN